MDFEDGAMVKSSNSCWSARGLALSVDVLWFRDWETRIVAGSLALSVVEAEIVGNSRSCWTARSSAEAGGGGWDWEVQWCSERGVLGEFCRF